MKIAVISRRDSWYRRDLERAIRANGHEFFRIDFPRLTGQLRRGHSLIETAGGRLAECDVVIVRTMPPGSLEQVVFRMDALAEIEAAGVEVINPAKALECAVDKYLATARIQAAGLPIPSSIVCENAESAMAAFENLGGDVVVKPLFGSEGRGIVRVSDPDLAYRTFRTLEHIRSVLFLQEFIPHGDSDIRVLVMGNRVQGAIRRSSPGDFRSNIARRGKATRHQPNDREVEYALRATDAVGAVLAGVDVLYDIERGQPVVIEVNGVPGWRAFRRATEIDVAANLIRFLELSDRPHGSTNATQHVSADSDGPTTDVPGSPQLT